jgi:hypothetical protein
MTRCSTIGKTFLGGLLVSGMMLVDAGGMPQISAQTTPLYRARYTQSPPTIDGLLTDATEWSDAEPGGDGWKVFRSTVSDTTNNRFAMLWNESGLYYQHQVDYASWLDRGNQDWDALYENLNLFFDPDTDGEANENQEIFGYSTDGYHLAVNQPLIDPETAPDVQLPGMFSDAYVNAIFGDSAAPYSGFAGIQIAQRNSVDENLGYLELFIPWSQFDATNPTAGTYPENGLYHPEPPTDGQQWYFNAARAQTNGTLLAWTSSTSAFFFNERPHGVLEFVREAANPCDLDGNGACDGADIDAIASAILAGSADGVFDVNGDSVVTDADRLHYIEVVLNTWVGDSNLDGQFSTRDFVAVFQLGGYEDGIPGNAGWASGDWNGDLDFTTRDFVAAFQSGGFEVGPRAAVAAVPEPSALALTLLGLFAVASRFRRR